MIKRFPNSAEKLSAILSLSSEVFFSNKKLNHSYCRPLTLLLCAIQQLNFSDSLRFLCAHFLHDWLHKIFLCQTQKQIAENVAHQPSCLLFPLRSIHSTNHYHNLFPAITGLLRKNCYIKILSSVPVIMKQPRCKQIFSQASI